MNQRHRILFGAAVVLLGLGGLIVWEIGALRNARARLAELTARRGAMAREVENARRLEARWKQEAQPLEKGLVLVQAKKQAREDKRRAQRAAQEKGFRGWLALRDGALYRKLGLTPEQIGKYEELSREHYLRMQDIASTATADKLPFGDPAIKALAKQEMQQLNQDAADLLGAAGAQVAQQYDRTVVARMVANGLAGDMFYTAEPLSSDQADQLAQMLANNSASYQKGGVMTMSPKDINMSAVETQAQAALSPGQIAALENYNQGIQAIFELNQLLAAAVKPRPASAGK